VKFSIITPGFNQLDWLRLAVASVRDQIDVASNAMRNPDSEFHIPNSKLDIPTLAVEHIIQDAGSPGIEEFAREIGADFYRDGTLISHSTFRISNYSLAIFSERDEGMYDAINRGLRRSTGTICAWLNCDEQYLPEALSRVARFFDAHPEAEMLVGDTVLLNEHLEARSFRPGIPPIREYVQAFNLNLHSSSLFFRKSILDRGMWLGNRFRSIGDSEWIARLLDSGVKIHAFPETISTFVLGAKNLSGNALSAGEKALWKSEMPIPAGGLIFLKLRHLSRRIRAGAYFPRRRAVSLFMPGDPARRRDSPPRWLDFRFRS